MRVAIIHDWLVTYAGAERVLERMIKAFPDADLFSLIDNLGQENRAFIQHKTVQTSFVERLPWGKSKYRNYLPIMPLAVEQFDLSKYDLVLSSSHAVAKGVLTGPDQLHLCMCYSPIRYAWDLQHQYIRESGLERGLKGWLVRFFLHGIRQWDIRTANGVDGFIAISNFIARRIWKVYRRESTVIYPPVDTNAFVPGKKREDYYVTASRLVPYKRIDLIVEAFTEMPNRRLVVIGDGPDMAKIIHKAGPNVTILGHQPFEGLKSYLQGARAFIFAAEEDFGISPIEAQASGTPVIAFGKGGTLETIQGLEHDEPTGIFFPEQTVSALTEAVRRFEAVGDRFTADSCRKNALRFSQDRFDQEFCAYVESQLIAFRHNRG